MNISDDLKKLLREEKKGVEEIASRKEREEREKERKAKERKEKLIKNFIPEANKNTKQLNSTIIIKILDAFIDHKKNMIEQSLMDFSEDTIIEINYPNCIQLDMVDFNKDYSNQMVPNMIYHLISLPKDIQDVYKGYKDYNSNHPYPIVFFENEKTKTVEQAFFNYDYFRKLGFTVTLSVSGIQLKVLYKNLNTFVKSYLVNNIDSLDKEVNEKLKKVLTEDKKIENIRKGPLEVIRECGKNLEIVSLDIFKNLIAEYKKKNDYGKGIIYQITMPCTKLEYPWSLDYIIKNKKLLDKFGLTKEKATFYRENLGKDTLTFFEHKKGDTIEYLPVITSKLQALMRELECNISYYEYGNARYKGKYTIRINSTDLVDLILNQKEVEKETETKNI